MCVSGRPTSTTIRTISAFFTRCPVEQFACQPVGVEADEELHTEARLELGANLEASSRMMNRGFDMKVMKTVAVAAALAGCVACGGNGEEVPAVEQQTVTPPQATAMPERVRGCLGAGETEGTYVLTAGAVDTRTDAATYHLLG